MARRDLSEKVEWNEYGSDRRGVPWHHIITFSTEVFCEEKNLTIQPTAIARHLYDNSPLTRRRSPHFSAFRYHPTVPPHLPSLRPSPFKFGMESAALNFGRHNESPTEHPLFRLPALTGFNDGGASDVMLEAQAQAHAQLQATVRSPGRRAMPQTNRRNSPATTRIAALRWATSVEGRVLGGVEREDAEAKTRMDDVARSGEEDEKAGGGGGEKKKRITVRRGAGTKKIVGKSRAPARAIAVMHVMEPGDAPIKMYACPIDNCDRLFKWRSSLHHHRKSAVHKGEEGSVAAAPVRKRQRVASKHGTARRKAGAGEKAKVADTSFLGAARGKVANKAVEAIEMAAHSLSPTATAGLTRCDALTPLKDGRADQFGVFGGGMSVGSACTVGGDPETALWDENVGFGSGSSAVTPTKPLSGTAGASATGEGVGTLDILAGLFAEGTENSLLYQDYASGM